MRGELSEMLKLEKRCKDFQALRVQEVDVDLLQFNKLNAAVEKKSKVY